MRKREWESRPVKKLNPWHALRAREAFAKALVEVWFESELQSFAREVSRPGVPVRRSLPRVADVRTGHECVLRAVGADLRVVSRSTADDLSWASHHSIPKRGFTVTLSPACSALSR